jgi:hypothetical protein
MLSVMRNHLSTLTAYKYACDLCSYTRGRLSLRAALALATSAPALLRLPPGRLAERAAAHAGALGLPVADVAGLLARNPQLVDAAPLRRAGAPV